MYRGTLEPVSNLETWTNFLEFFDDETGEPAFIGNDSDTHPDQVTLSLREKGCGATVLSGSLGAQLSIVGDGVIEFAFDISALNPKTYEIGVLYKIEGRTTQAILGEISVLKGL